VAKATSKNKEMKAPKVAIIDQQGKETSTVDINPFFTSEELLTGFNPTFVHQIVLTYLDNQRQATAKVKTRAEVRGGGRKPWRQKGTGRARQGSIRSPLWRKGGITFGPTSLQNFSKKLTKKMKKKALRFALLSMIKNNNLVIVDQIEPSDSTKTFNQFLSRLPLSDQSILIIDQKNSPLIPFATNNSHVNITSPELLNPLDLFRADCLLCSQEIFQVILNRVKPPFLEAAKKTTKSK